MSDHLTKARKAYEERRSAVEQLVALGEAAGDNEFNEEQRATADKINADIDRLDAECQRYLREGELQERSNALDTLIGEQRDDGKVDDNGYTPIENEARGLFLGADHDEFRSRLDFEATSTDIANMARRDLLAGTATDGAELVPTTLFGQLYVALREGATSMFSLSRGVITPGGEPMEFPKSTAFSTATRVAEAGSISESDPQFGTVSIGAYKYALAVQVSPELDADQAVPGALPWVIDQAVDGIRRGVGAELLTADGSSKPNGVMNGSTTSTIAGVTYPTADALIETMYDITSPYRTNAVWLFNDDTVKGIRLIKDSDGQYIWQPGLVAGAPDRLLGHNVYTDEGVATVGSDAKIGIFGDLKKGYITRTAGNIRADRSAEYAFLNDLITWRFAGRFDGEIMDNAAFTVLTNENS